MKRKRTLYRIVFLILALCIILELSSCGGGTVKDATTVTNSTDKGEPDITSAIPGGSASKTDTSRPVTGPQTDTVSDPPSTEAPSTGPVTGSGTPGTSEPVFPPLPHMHTFGEWEITKTAGCTESGERTRTCAGCGMVEKETVPPAGHNTGKWIEKVAPNGEKDGAPGHYICSVCGEWLDGDDQLIPEEDRVIKAGNIIITVRCYCGDELLLTSRTQYLQSEDSMTIDPPEIEYYDGEGILSQPVKKNEDRTVDFRGYKPAYKVISGKVNGSGNSVTTGAANTLALKNELRGEGALSVTVTAGNKQKNGIVFCYTENNGNKSYYWFYTQRSNNTVNLAKVTNGKTEILYSNYLSADYNVNNAATSKIVFKDGKAYCYFWNTLITVCDIGNIEGGYGFASDSSGVRYAFDQFDSGAKVQTVDTLLFGHSYFAWWNNFYYSNLKRNMEKIENTGSWADIAIGGSIASHWNKYLPSILTYRPTLGIYMIGINDITIGTPPAEVANNVKTLLLDIKAEIPEFRAVLMGVNRCSARISLNDVIAEINREYKLIAASYDWIYFADIEYSFCDDNGDPVSNKFSDGLHPTQVSFNNIITPAIISALKGENQPDISEIVGELKAKLLKQIEEIDIEESYPDDQDLLRLTDEIKNAKSIDALNSAYESFKLEIRKENNKRAILLMDDIFSDDRSQRSSWDAVVNNVKTWTHTPGTDCVIINHNRVAGWQLTKQSYSDFEMTVKVDLPTPNNPYGSIVTRSFLFGASSAGNYPKGYALTIYKYQTESATDNWIQLHYLNGNSLAGTFLGGLYGDFSDKEVTFAVENGRFYLRLNGDPTGLTNASLNATIPYIELDYYGTGGSIGILSWDNSSSLDARMTIAAFREIPMTLEQMRAIVEGYVESIDAEKNYPDNQQISGLISEIGSADTVEKLSSLYSELIKAVELAQSQSGAAIMDAIFSDDDSTRSSWDAVVNNVKTWTHTPGTDYVIINHNRVAGWQLTKQTYKDFEMTVKVDEPTPNNPYGAIVTRSFLFGATSAGNFPKGYALTIYKYETDNWIQLHYLDGSGVSGVFLGGLYGDFTDKEVTFAVKEGKFYLIINGETVNMTNASLNGTIDHIDLENYGDGGSVGIISWDNGSSRDAKMSITNFRIL